MSRLRFEMFEYRQVLVRMRQGDSDREFARSRLTGRCKAAALRRVDLARGWRDPATPLPDDAARKQGQPLPGNGSRMMAVLDFDWTSRLP